MRMVFHTIGKNLAASDNSVVVACLVEKDAITGFRIAISATETPACRYRMPLSGESNMIRKLVWTVPLVTPVPQNDECF